MFHKQNVGTISESDILQFPGTNISKWDGELQMEWVRRNSVSISSKASVCSASSISKRSFGTQTGAGRDRTTFRLVDELLHLLSSSYAIYPSITTGPRKEQGDRKGWPLFQSKKRAIVAQTAETVHAGSDTCRAHPLLKVPAMGMWASEPDHGFFYTTWLAGIMAPGHTTRKRQAGTGSVTLWATLCWGTSGSTLYSTFSTTNYSNQLTMARHDSDQLVFHYNQLPPNVHGRCHSNACPVI